MKRVALGGLNSPYPDHSRVDQFGVSEIDCPKEPSAVAADAGVNFHIKQVAHHPAVV